MSALRIFGLIGVVVFFVQGCSFDKPEIPLGGLKIAIEKTSDLSVFSFDPGLFTTPTTISDFACFSVNVTGSGVLATNKISGASCTSSNNYNGKGPGVLTHPISSGNTIEVDIPSGPSRVIDVYGFYPSPPPCGTTWSPSSGTISAYLLGSKTIDLNASTSVTIPVSFSSTLPVSLTCVETTNGSSSGWTSVALTDAGGYGCTSYASPPTVPAPTSALLGTAFTTPELTEISISNGTDVLKECTSGGGTQAEFVEYRFDVSALTLSNYTSVRVTWVGQSGIYVGACSSSSLPYSSGGGEIWIYRYNSGSPSWQQIGSSTDGTSAYHSFSTTVSSPSTLPFTNNMIYVRAISPAASTSQCGAIRTDAIKLELQ